MTNLNHFYDWEVGISRALGIDLRTIVIMANGRSPLVLLCNMGQCDEYFELGCHLSSSVPVGRSSRHIDFLLLFAIVQCPTVVTYIALFLHRLSVGEYRCLKRLLEPFCNALFEFFLLPWN